ncbi:DUF6879 family protein [Actinacidiphila yeochonensis]|uniref:DUF6879 family protein n=1 Tax=Actinacidiphila yeochonensis TaxID=89050 RepID=UPI000559ECC8|nr:DUF6879 family protein [Actinacidiphila yeochonensis]
MFDSFPDGTFERLKRPAYHEEFNRILKSGIETQDKLERGQHFQERGFASWEAFAAGRWEEALELVEEKRPIYTAQLAEAEGLGVVQRRLRVVEFPVTPYVQWEMHVLRLRVEVGDRMRVLDARTIADIERERSVPEIVVLGDVAIYEVQYDPEGNADGARRYSDPALIAETLADFETLYGRSEPFVDFFEREILPLGPPAVGG